MTKIALRQYNRDTARLINNGQAEEAAAHCRHILTALPRHSTSTRHLANACLEMNDFTGAAEAFSRLLACMPVDYFAQVGMSIALEAGGNLESAVWHMQRACELEPANAALQDELHRLHEKQTGIRSERANLTRATLARMYLEGSLYPQAAAELLAALDDDPQRTDLLSMLLIVYWRAELSLEASKTADKLLELCPYCLEANLYLDQHFSASPGAVNPYRLHLQELDPYYAYISPGYPTPELVPDQWVELQLLEHQGTA